MSADRPGLDKRIVRGFLGGAAAGIMASAAVISAPSVEASSLAAIQPGLKTSFAPEKSSVKALGCAPAFGIRIPTS